MTLKDKKEESNGIVSTVLTKSLIQDLRQIINSLRFSLTFKLSHHWCENCLGLIFCKLCQLKTKLSANFI